MAAVPHRPRLPATGPIFIHIDRHGNIGHRMFRNGEKSGDPSGRTTGDGIAEIVTRAVARAGLTARPNGLLAPDLPPGGPATPYAEDSPPPPARSAPTRSQRVAKVDGTTAQRPSPTISSRPASEETNPHYAIGL
ncbi:hypothetical protein [Streptomyces sp. NPDC057557]|uniref:hypothetical protein n=1 Tax=Streptomyces sp. NPDC057557 TaxID=3346167 RepID=UPI003675E181